MLIRKKILLCFFFDNKFILNWVIVILVENVIINVKIVIV